MQLNFFSGRTYNDLTQYPVMPWILADYTSSQIDLANPCVYRDLSKPIAVQDDARVSAFQDRWCIHWCIHYHMYVCIHYHMYVYIHYHMYVYIIICMYTLSYVCIHYHMYTYIIICMYIGIDLYAVWERWCMFVYIYVCCRTDHAYIMYVCIFV
jgi:hypothetical protein